MAITSIKNNASNSIYTENDIKAIHNYIKTYLGQENNIAMLKSKPFLCNTFYEENKKV